MQTLRQGRYQCRLQDAWLYGASELSRTTGMCLGADRSGTCTVVGAIYPSLRICGYLRERTGTLWS